MKNQQILDVCLHFVTKHIGYGIICIPVIVPLIPDLEFQRLVIVLLLVDGDISASFKSFISWTQRLGEIQISVFSMLLFNMPRHGRIKAKCCHTAITLEKRILISRGNSFPGHLQRARGDHSISDLAILHHLISSYTMDSSHLGHLLMLSCSEFRSSSSFFI